MPTDRFGELKARQAVSWGAAPFERVTETFADIHDSLMARLVPRPGESWLDVATGTGPLALRAARAGTTVVAMDLAPALIATARRLAGAEGLAIVDAHRDGGGVRFPREYLLVLGRRR